MGRYIKEADIVRFIDELPGGSVPQYARLLATSPTRINKLLKGKSAKRLVLQKKVMAPPIGMLPYWAEDNHPRGELDANNIKTLPPFVSALLDAMHPTYRDDGLLLFKTLIEMASGRKNFEDGLTTMSEMYSDITHHVAGLELQLDDRRQKLLLLEQENRFWRGSLREVVEEHNIKLPPLMSNELKLEDLRASAGSVIEEAALTADQDESEADIAA